MTDKSIQGTNDSASECKLSAISKGYYTDDFLEIFVKESSSQTSPPNATRKKFTLPPTHPHPQPQSQSQQQPEQSQPQANVSSFAKFNYERPKRQNRAPKQRHSPIIHRGYYCRVLAFYNVVEKFLSLDSSNTGVRKKKQIISLGAGFDTLFWRLKKAGHQFDKFVEIDFATVTSKKCTTIKSQKVLSDPIGDISTQSDNNEIFTDCYNLIEGDLREASKLIEKMSHILDFSEESDTLFLAECVLIYLPVESSSLFLKNIATSFKGATSIISYEQIKPDDAFGKVMTNNLSKINISLLGLEELKTVEDQINRLIECGFTFSGGNDMLKVYQKIPNVEQQRVQRLEMLDELEEWNIMMQHYCLAIGSTNETFLRELLSALYF